MGIKTGRALAALALTASVAVTGCAETKTQSGGSGSTAALTTGTTDKVTSLDPAGS